VTRSVHLQLVVDGDPEPLVLDSRKVSDGDHLGAYQLATLLLECAARLITWQSFRDRFDAITTGMEEAS